MYRWAPLAFLAALAAAEPVELATFRGLPRPEPTLQVRYGSDLGDRRLPAFGRGAASRRHLGSRRLLECRDRGPRAIAASRG